MSNTDGREVILQLKDVTKQFPASKGRLLTANDHITLDVYRGETLGLAGESGCGKRSFSAGRTLQN